MNTNMTKLMIVPAVLFLLCANSGTGRCGGPDNAEPAASPASLSPDEAVRWLEGLNVFYEQDYLRTAIARAFGNRIDEGISHAIETLRLPGRDEAGKPVPGRAKAYFVARNILLVYAEAAAERIPAAYDAGDAVARANLINVSGAIPGEDVTGMLVRALDDRTFLDDHDPERAGEPLRICDLAYNQLVLRFRIKGVLRTIGPALGTVNRDYHISILRGKL